MGAGYHGGFGGTLGSTYDSGTNGSRGQSYSDREITIPDNLKSILGIILQETDLIDETHFPAIALINEAFNSDPLKFVNNLSNGIGSGYNYSNCSFWGELDDYDKSNTPKFDGLLISTEDNEELVISLGDFIHYLEIACDRIAGTEYLEIQALKTSIEALKVKNNG